MRRGLGFVHRGQGPIVITRSRPSPLQAPRLARDASRRRVRLRSRAASRARFRPARSVGSGRALDGSGQGPCRGRRFHQCFRAWGFEHGRCSASCFSAGRERGRACVEGVRASVMKIVELVDEPVRGVRRSDRALALGERTRPSSRASPRARRRVPGAASFPHEVTLGAPALFAESLSGVPRSLMRRRRARAHARGHRLVRDRAHRGRAHRGVAAGLRRSRARAERARQGHAAPLQPHAPRRDGLPRRRRHDHPRAARRASDARVGRSRGPRVYEQTIVDKRCSGILASLALARIGGAVRGDAAPFAPRWNRSTRARQIYDDVVDWEADLKRGGAWATCLMRGTVAPRHSGKHAKRRGARASSELLELRRARAHARARPACTCGRPTAGGRARRRRDSRRGRPRRRAHPSSCGDRHGSRRDAPGSGRVAA